ncbi:MAG: [protein-PII] uridylyltransferase [Pseudomonadota bacterium]|nr:MAG: [protein-PII] uridylyltransferase [Pseudomonadota bacterium]
MVSVPARLADAAGASRQRLATGRAALAAAFRTDRAAARYLRAHCRLIDQLLREAWQAAALPRDFALVAVGGYGRGDQFPHSDVDVLVLLPAAPEAAVAQTLERFVGGLWDLGLNIGHSVRTIDECIEEAAKDITVQTALLEARYLCGSRRLYERLRATFTARLDPRLFFRAKLLEQQQRHAKYQDSPYSLEPNIKEAPGGLRDLQTILWMSRAAGFGADWNELAERALITREEARSLRRHENWLKGLRLRLHLLAGRREERILFDHQEALAREYGFSGQQGKRASEVFMQHYYRVAKAITQLNTILIQNLEAALFPDDGTGTEAINERFLRQRDLLHARDPELFEREPAAILESFLLLQQHSELKGMTAPTLRALWRARVRIDAAFRRNPRHRALFLQILQQPRGIVHELRRMNQYDILGRYLPAFGRIVGQMQHDLFHVYTVDQHILMVVRNLRRFTLAEYAHEYPLCSRLMTTFERNWLLYIAALFHDIAKGRGGDHSQLGKADALQFCRAHGLSAEDTELVAFLVEHHLTMSNTAQKRDLTDPDVVREFAAIVGSERRLVALYLLTVADIRGTSPTVWNAWKGKLLEDLFHATRRVLSGPGEPLDLDVHARQSEALRLLRLQALPDEYAERLWRHLDVAYFLRHEPDDIAWQTRNLHWRVNTEKPVVKARVFPSGEGLQVMVYSRADRDLFARICGYFESINFNIAEARIHTTRHGYSLNSFVVLGMSTSHQYRDLVNLIEYELSEHLERKAPLGPPARGRVSRQLKHFPIAPDVQIRPDDKHQYHLLSVTAGDQPGLLYRIARVLSAHEITLHMAKIVTLGERAEDVFVVSGAALEDEKRVLQLEQELLEALA